MTEPQTVTRDEFEGLAESIRELRKDIKGLGVDLGRVAGHVGRPQYQALMFAFGVFSFVIISMAGLYTWGQNRLEAEKDRHVTAMVGETTKVEARLLERIAAVDDRSEARKASVEEKLEAIAVTASSATVSAESRVHDQVVAVDGRSELRKMAVEEKISALQNTLTDTAHSVTALSEKFKEVEEQFKGRDKLTETELEALERDRDVLMGWMMGAIAENSGLVERIGALERKNGIVRGGE